MNDARNFGAEAAQYVGSLLNTVGPRPAGSAQEAQARDWVASILLQSGYQVERSPAMFAPLARFSILDFLVGVGLILGGLTLVRPEEVPVPVSLLAALTLPLWTAALPDLRRWLLMRRKRSEKSENLWAWREPVGRQTKTLLLCAHVDSATVLPFPAGFLRRLYGLTLDIAQRAAILVSALAALRLWGFALPLPIAGISLLLAALAGSWMIFSALLSATSARPYAPGANDDASGVAVLLAVANWAAQRSFQQVRLGFLFTGAEETGLHGAQAFVEQMPAEAHWEVLCLDMVGVGSQARYASHEGVFRPVRSPEIWARRLKAVCPEIRPLSYSHRSGDFAAFLRSGISATNLEMTGDRAGEIYHSLEDIPAQIQPQALQKAAEIVIGLIERVDQEETEASKAGSLR